ncbi:non-ribosomal peptide synthetase [Derxia gummosa]|uniref:Non-ribosomal peptide synthetase n=1 Tax=Derxia gummosa DSM 723 TaxID=1121388 RepID=A0A8B6X7X5_9BURK|nr:non-ribosomal peptide synthetase [Derxia gummosa]
MSPRDTPAAAALPLTEAQAGIWFGQQLVADSPIYQTAEALDLDGPLDRDVFLAAVRHALDEAEALHLRAGLVDGRLLQWPAGRDWQPEWIDCSTAADPDAAADAWIAADLAAPVDLARDPLFRCALLRLGPARHRWLLRAHHLALDGYGHALVARRVAALHSAALDRYPAPPGALHTLADVVAEEAAWLASPAADRAREHWRAELADAPDPVTLAPPAPLGGPVRRERRAPDTARLARWQAAARAAGTDLHAWLLAATAAWLWRETGATDLTLGLPVMNRLGSVALTVPCMTMNIVPLRLRVAPDAGLDQLAREVVARLRAGRPHARYRYEKLRHDLGRAAPGRRLFAPVVNLLAFDRLDRVGPLRATRRPIAAGPVDDLSIVFAPGPDGLGIDAEANPLAYDAAMLARIADGLVAMLDAFALAPGATPAEVAGRLAATLPCARALPAAPARLDGGPPPGAAADVLDAFRARVAATPAATAIETTDGRRLDYAALERAVQRLAGELASHGIGPGDRVALLLPRAPEAVVAMLATLWTGAAYVPLDPAGPRARIADVLDDVRPARVLVRPATATLAGDWPWIVVHEDAGAATAGARPLPPRPVPPDAPAYVIHTSGSTGRPNGVVIGRGALAHFVAAAGWRYGIDARDRVLQFAPLHFDASVEEIHLSLAHGATLVLRDDAMLDSLGGFLAACGRLAISVLDLPTAFWHELAWRLGDDCRLPPALRLVIIGGEAVLADRVARWRAAAPTGPRLVNSYGPTETTVICTTAELGAPADDGTTPAALPIGQPLAGLSMVVVDAWLHPVMAGAEGELCVLGPMLANGYFERPARDAARFVRLPALPGAPRAYRTGDRVRLDGDQLVYLGRIDDEIKLSGHRIDPAEVESVLLGCDGVIGAAVAAQPLAGGLRRLVAFVVPERPPTASAPAALAPATSAGWRARLARRLPAPAVPDAFFAVAELPRNANGKIDRKALLARLPAVTAAPDAAAADARADAAAPVAGSVLDALLATWREVLGLDGLGADDDFFALGGKSLQAIQVTSRLGQRLGRELPMSLLFRHPRAADLAAVLDAGAGRHAGNDAGIDAGIEAGADAPAGAGIASGGAANRVPADAGAAPTAAFAPLFTLQHGAAPALFCLHPAEGLSWCYLGLARHLPALALHGLQARGLSAEPPADFAAMAADHLARLRGVQPHGPYRLLGWSSGGALAHEIAARLRAAGEAVELLALMDAYPATAWTHRPEPSAADALEALLDITGDSPLDAAGEPLPPAAMRALLARPGSPLAGCDAALIDRLADTALHTMRAFRASTPAVFDGPLLFFRAARRPADAPEPASWRPHVTGAIEVIDIDATHSGLAAPAALDRIGAELARRLASTAPTRKES